VPRVRDTGTPGHDRRDHGQEMLASGALLSALFSVLSFRIQLATCLAAVDTPTSRVGNEFTFPCPLPPTSCLFRSAGGPIARIEAKSWWSVLAARINCVDKRDHEGRSYRGSPRVRIRPLAESKSATLRARGCIARGELSNSLIRFGSYTEASKWTKDLPGKRCLLPGHFA
jgi:hypothetical protein